MEHLGFVQGAHKLNMNIQEMNEQRKTKFVVNYIVGLGIFNNNKKNLLELNKVKATLPDKILKTWSFLHRTLYSKAHCITPV